MRASFGNSSYTSATRSGESTRIALPLTVADLIFGPPLRQET